MSDCDGGRPGDLYIHRPCQECGSDVLTKAVPFGEPTALLLTGVCDNCLSTLIALDALDGDVRVAALQLSDLFHQVGHSAHMNRH
jgi:hypothetical protein